MGQRRVDIRLQGRPDVGVAQKLTEALDVHAIFHAPGRVGVPEGVEVPIADTAALQQLSIPVLQCARLHRCVRIGEKVVIF